MERHREQDVPTGIESASESYKDEQLLKGRLPVSLGKIAAGRVFLAAKVFADTGNRSSYFQRRSQ